MPIRYAENDNRITQGKIPIVSIMRGKNISVYGDNITDNLNERIFIFGTEEGAHSINGLTEYGKTLTSIDIPKTYNNGIPVKTLSTKAFENCTKARNITIPNSINKIQDKAFLGCSANITWEQDATITEILPYAFWGYSNNNNLIIPEGVTQIGEYAFGGSSFIVTLNYNGTPGYETTDIFCTDKISLTYPDVPMRNGYAFCGWYDNIDGTGSPWDFSQDIEQNITLYAKWEKLSKSGFEYVDITEQYNTVVTRFSALTSDTAKGFYFTALTSGTLTLHGYTSAYSSILTSPNFSVYTSTGEERVSIKPSVENFTRSFSVNAGEILYAQARSGSVGNARVAMYITGAETPAAGGNAKYRINNITIPSTVTSLQPYAFANCAADITYSSPSITNWGELSYAYYAGDPCIVPENLVTMHENVFGEDTVTFTSMSAQNCTSLQNIIIPDSVTNISSTTFDNCVNLTSINIGKGVTSIAESAFVDCTSLTSIEVSVDNENYKSIDGNLYSKDGLTLIRYAPDKMDTSFIIPDGVTRIGNNAFAGCSNLTSVTIPDGVTGIGDYAFSNCTSLTSITIPNGVTSIGNYAFSGCSSLTSVIVPGSVASMGYHAFEGCPAQVKETDGGIIYYDKWAIGYEDDITSATIREGTVGIAAQAFYKCSGLTSITIPDSVIGIGDSAFYGCSSLTSITIHDGMTSIGSNAFAGYSGLTSIYYTGDMSSWLGKNWHSRVMSSSRTLYLDGNKVEGEIIIPDGTTAIPSYAFAYQTIITSVTIPDSVTSIGDSAFYRCWGLTSITIPDSVTSIGNSAFEDCRNITSITIGNAVTRIGNNAFAGCSNLTSVTIPDGVTSIGSGAFCDCSGLTSITIPFVGATKDGTEDTHFGYIFGASSSNSNDDYVPASLKEVVITGGTSIGEYAFYRCNSITSVDIEDGVIYIGARAFYYCTGLTSVTIWKTVTSIGDYAFYNCTGLTYVNIGTVAASFGDGVTSIGNYAFSGCSGLTSLTIPDSVISIGMYAFSDCSGLTSITLPFDLTSIENGTFRNCTGLTSIVIRSKVTSIGMYAFYGCSSLTSVKFSGRMAIWNAISKETGWNRNCPFTEVVCTDGSVSV